MDKLPCSPGARRARAVVEHTRKPGGLPRPERRGHLRAGTPAHAGGEWGRQVSERSRRYPHPSLYPIGYLFFFHEHRGFEPLTCCDRWISSPVYRVPAGHERLLSTRGSPVGSRAPRGEDTSEPVPRLLPGASGAVRSANGRVDSPIHPQKPNQKTIWFGFCFALIFNTYARLGIARSQARHRPAGRKTPPKGQKAYLSRRSFSGDGSMPTCHGVSKRSRKPVLLSANAF